MGRSTKRRRQSGSDSSVGSAMASARRSTKKRATGQGRRPTGDESASDAPDLPPPEPVLTLESPTRPSARDSRRRRKATRGLDGDARATDDADDDDDDHDGAPSHRRARAARAASPCSSAASDAEPQHEADECGPTAAAVEDEEDDDDDARDIAALEATFDESPEIAAERLLTIVARRTERVEALLRDGGADGGVDAMNKEVSERGLPGTIVSVHLERFMHFDNFKVEFGPFVNFVVGGNGAGKSCVLTAICCALGMQAKHTARARGLGELIRDKAKEAVVTVVMRNHTSDAFQPEVFGETIAVSRRLRRSDKNVVTSFYSMWGARHASARAGLQGTDALRTLKRMLTHFNIDLTNPYCVLNQTMAKEFVTATPAQMYKFYSEATQLARLDEHVAAMNRNLEAAATLVDAKKRELRVRIDELAVIKAKLHEMDQVQQLHVRLKEAITCKGWAHAVAKEKQIEAARASDEALASENAKLAAAHVDAVAQLAASKAELLRDNEQQMSEARESAALAARVGQLKSERDQLDAEVEVGVVERERVAKNIERLSKEKAAAEAALESLRAEQLADQSDAARRVASREAAKREKVAAITTSNEQLDRCARERGLLDDEIVRLRRERGEAEAAADRARKDVSKASAQAAALAAGGVSASAAQFGGADASRLASLFAEHAGEFTSPPIGPIGATLRLRDTSWSAPLASALGPMCSGFMLNDRSDQATATRLAQAVGINRMPKLFVSKFQHRLHVEPARGSLLAVLDAPVPVLNLLIDLKSVERIVLFDSDVAADAIEAVKSRAAFVAWTRKSVVEGRDDGSGRVKTSLQPHWRDSGIRFGADNAEALAAAQEQIERARGVEASARAAVDRARVAERMQGDRQAEVCAREMELTRTCKALRKELGVLEAEVEDDLADKLEPAIEEVKRKAEGLDKLQAKATSLATLAEQLARRRQPILDELGATEAKLTGYMERARAATATTNAIDARIKQASAMRSTTERRLEENKRTSAEALDKLAGLESELGELVSAARARGPRPAQIESIAVYHALIERLKLDKAQQEAKHGGVDYAKLSGKGAELKASIRVLGEQIKKQEVAWTHLNNALGKHKIKYNTIRLQTTGRLSLRFRKFTSMRENINSQIAVNETDQVIDVTFRANAAESVERHARDLSGGERSFVTTSFLLTLWTIASTPFGALDEFDVYMDTSARATMLRTLGSLATSPAARWMQTFFLVNDASDITNTIPNVRIIAMPDPVRGAADAARQ